MLVFGACGGGEGEEPCGATDTPATTATPYRDERAGTGTGGTGGAGGGVAPGGGGVVLSDRGSGIVRPPGWWPGAAGAFAWRPASRRERADHGWRRGTVLVVNPGLDAALDRDEPVLRVALPPLGAAGVRLGPSGGVSLVLRRKGEVPGPVVTELATGRRPVRRRSSFVLYEVEDAASAGRARAWVGPEPAVDVLGVAAGVGFELRGPFRWGDRRLDEPIPAGVRGVYVVEPRADAEAIHLWGLPGPAAVTENQCADGLDNDGDGVGDGCDWACVAHPTFDGARYGPPPLAWEHSRNVAMVGDAPWCTEMADVWETVLFARAQDAASLLNQVEAPPEHDLGSRVHPVQVRDLACVIAPDLEEAKDCQRLPPVQFPDACTGVLAGYPLAGDDDVAPRLLDDVWAYFEWLLDGGLGVPKLAGPGPIPVSLVQVVVYEQTLASSDLGGAPIYGKSPKPLSPLGIAGGSVTARGGPVCLAAHEYGHTLGLPHDDAGGFMNVYGGDCSPVLGLRVEDWPIKAHGYEIWTSPDHGGSKWFPRSDGFVYQGCTLGGDCPLGTTCQSSLEGPQCR